MNSPQNSPDLHPDSAPVDEPAARLRFPARAWRHSYRVARTSVGFLRRGGVSEIVEGRLSRTVRGMSYGLVIALLSIGLLGSRAFVANWGDSLRDNWLILRSVVSQGEGETEAANISPNVGLIEIDRATRQSWNGRTFNARDLGRLLVLLRRNGVAAVALDLPDINAAFMDAAEQKALARAIKQSGNVFLPLPTGERGDFAIQVPVKSLNAKSLNAKSLNAKSLNAKSPSSKSSKSEYSKSEYLKDAPAQRFAALSRAAAGAGHITLWLDNDGHVRRVPLQYRRGGATHLSLPLVCALARLGLSARDLQPLDAHGNNASWSEATHCRMGGRIFSLSASGTLLLNFTPPLPVPVREGSQNGLGDLTSTRGVPQAPLFNTLSMRDVLLRPEKLAILRGQSVVIGVSDSAISPQYLLANGARVPEMKIHAIALDSLLSGQTLSIVPPISLWILTILLALSVGGIVAARPPLWSALIAMMGLLAILVLSLGLFVQDIWLDVTLPCVAAFLAWLQGVIWRARLQERETTRVAAAVETLERTGEIVSQRSPAGELLPRVLQWIVASSEAESASALLLQSENTSHRVLDPRVLDGGNSPFSGAFEAEQWQETAPSRQRKRGTDALSADVRSAIFAHIQRSGESLWVRDVRRDTRFWPRGRSLISFDSGLNVLSVMAAPLRVGGVQSGAILVVNGRDGLPFSNADLQLLEAVANQASVALDNARLYDILNRRIKRSESELENANRDLQTEKNTLQAVLESMTDGVVVTDDKGNVQIVNPAARALMPELARCESQSLAECLPDVAVALAASMMTTDIDASSNDESLNDATTNTVQNAIPNANATSSTRCASSKSLFTSILIARGDKDSPRLIEARSAPLQSTVDDNSENVVTRGLVAVFADVTQERAAQQAKSDFVSFVAHEMRSPLTSISGFSSMLSRMEQNAADSSASASSPTSVAHTSVAPISVAPTSSTRSDTLADKNAATRARYLQVIWNESERLTRLINNLLDVARIEAGHALVLQAQKLDFGVIAREAIESQRLYSSRHTLVDGVPHDLPPVFADRDKTLQILINLLSNANKYSPGGQITISARVRDNALEGHHLEVRVQDEGPGIAPELQSRLFQRFGTLGSKGEAATNLGVGEKAKPTGTGLGLFLTRYLVELQGGRVRIESQPGHGATFIFTLPLWKRDAQITK